MIPNVTCILYYVDPYGPLGMGSESKHDITNEQLTGKYRSDETPPYFYYPVWQARLGNDVNTSSHEEKRFLSVDNPEGEWFQVDFYTPHRVVGLAIAGGEDLDALHFYSSTFLIHYSRSTLSEMEKILDVQGNDKVR